MYSQTSSYYQQKVNDVSNYINNHLADDLNVKLLSEQFGISFSHFHRILKAYLNEPLGSYINRVRLEIAIKLIRYSNESLSDIALQIGYNDCSAFSKAFSKEFGLSPLEFKNNKEIVLNTHVDYKINDFGKLITDIKPKIIQMADKLVIYKRFKGKYGSEEFSRAWDDFLGFAINNKLVGWKPDIFSIYYDFLSDMEIDESATDFCIATSRPIAASYHIDSKVIVGGKYAVFRYKGPYDRLWELYETIFGVWVINSDVRLRDYPIIEKYLNYSFNGNPNNFLTEIYLPIE
jgi:AraC family transcriptional regulator